MESSTEQLSALDISKMEVVYDQVSKDCICDGLCMDCALQVLEQAKQSGSIGVCEIFKRSSEKWQR